jgi:putative transcriptional regulator
LLTKGKILISEPYLGDATFERSVVLLCEHNDSGAFGFMLNKSTDFTVNSVLDEQLPFEQELFLGGPVAQDSLFFLLRQDKAILKDSVHIKDDLYWGGDFDHLKELIQDGSVEIHNCRFFLGYSGWSEDQLEQELESDSWIIADIDSEDMFSEKTASMWQDILRSMGGTYKMLSNYPIDPRLN